MVDIGHKAITARTAVARGEIMMSRTAFKALLSKGSPKGDVLTTARVAGIMAAKSAPAIIPLCHPLLLSKVEVNIAPDPKGSRVVVTAEVRCDGKTGVEMEALSAVSAALLTVYDMMKWADPTMVISEVKLIEKRGGKSGDFKR